MKANRGRYLKKSEKKAVQMCTIVLYSYREVKMKKEQTRSVGIRLPISWFKVIEKISEKECRTLNSVINQAVKEFLEKRKKLK